MSDLLVGLFDQLPQTASPTSECGPNLAAMAGAKHTNRHLQRLMLRGLVLPAAAAGAIVLGASAASADEGTEPVSPASADVQSPVEAAGTTVTSIAETTGAEPPTPSPARQPSSGPGSGGSVEHVTETAAALVENGPAESAKRPVADAVAVRGAAAVPGKDTAPDDEETGSAGTAGAAALLEPLPAEPLRAEALPAETSPAETSPAEPLPTEAMQPLRTATEPAEALSTRKSPAEVPPTEGLAAEATATVAEFTRPVTRPVDQTAAPLPDRLAETTDEATPVFDRLLDEVAPAAVPTVAETRLLDAELLHTLTEPVQEVEAVAGPTLTPVTDAANGLAEQALAPAAATTPIFTGLADGLLADLGAVATGTTDPVLAPLTETTPIFDRLTRESLVPGLDTAPVTGLVGQVTAPPLLSTTDPLLGQVVSPLLASSLAADLTPLTGVVSVSPSQLTAILLPGLDRASGVTASTAPAGPAWQPSPSSTTMTVLPAPAPATTASDWRADWSPAYDVPSSTTAAISSDADEARPVVAPLVGLLRAEESGLTGISVLGARGLYYPEGLAPVASQPTVEATSGAGSVDPLAGPDRNLLTQLGGLAEAITAAGGGTQGASGSVLLLLMAVFGAALLLRANGLAQLTPGTATALSGRAAQVQDRPG